MLIPTIAVSINVGDDGGSCWMAGQVRHSEKRDRHGRQKVLIPTISMSINGGGEGGSCWIAG